MRCSARVAGPITGWSIILNAPSLVSTMPHTIVFTRIPSHASSTANDRVSALIAF